MPELTLHLLGPPRVGLDGQPVQLGRHKAVALLAYLALTRQPHSRDALATLLWPDLDQSAARGQLRRTLSLLNRALGAGWLTVDRETAAWAPDAQAWVDVDHLRERLAGCAAHGHAARETCPQCIPLLAEAVGLYRDGFLAGFTLPDCPAFDEWQFFEGEGLRDQAADALQRLARWHGEREEYDAAIPYARRWLALDPLHEPAHRELMSLYARSGQRAAALRQYAECERVLGEELGLPPSPETTALHEAIRMGQELSTDTPDAAVAPPVPSSLRRHNLPVQGTPFVGRGPELNELDRLLSPAAETRLVTVMGPGGMGKTRLALEVASRQVARYPDGVWFVPLASVQSAEAIERTVAQALGVSFFGADPPRQQLLRYLREKRTLLLLDALGHLLEGFDLLVELLHTAPGVRVLVTSRVRLNLREEQAFTLGGMDYPELRAGVPGADDVRRYSSVALFLRSARRARSGFELREEDLPHVARICQLAQGMPLAILLAAAWVPALTPAEIAAEMEQGLDILAAEWRDEPERHHSVRAAFDATWGMLTEEERQVFARLSVFRGGFTREAADAVAGADLRTLMSLLSKSLLQRDRSGRYEVHELLRQYAAEKLDEVAEEREETLDLHCAYYAELLDRKKDEIRRGHRQGIVPELDNVRVAWQHAISHRLVTHLAKSLSGLTLFSHQERDAALGRAVDALRSENTASLPREEAFLLGKLLREHAFTVFFCGRGKQVLQILHESEEIMRHLGEDDELAWVLYVRAVLGAVESTTEAERLIQEALAFWREADRQENVPNALNSLGEYAIRRGAYRQAEQYFQEALRISRRFDDRLTTRWAYMFSGYAAYLQGEYSRARRLYERGMLVHQAIGSAMFLAEAFIPDTHYFLGQAAFASGEYEDAARHYGQALAGFEDLQIPLTFSLSGFCRGTGLCLVRLGDVALAVGDATGAERRYAQALRVAAEEPYPELRLEAVLGQAKLLAQTQGVASLQERAAELAMLVLCHPDGLQETRDAAQRLLDQVQADLPPDAYTAAQARGRARDLEATMRELLAEMSPGPHPKAAVEPEGGGDA